MLRRDFLQAEIQKLAQVLARIIGLKRDGKYHEAEKVIRETMVESFGFQPETLATQTEAEFEHRLSASGLPAEKLDKLAAFMFEAVHPLEDNEYTRDILRKILVIFSILETDYRQQSLENLNKQVRIKKFLNQNT